MKCSISICNENHDFICAVCGKPICLLHSWHMQCAVRVREDGKIKTIPVHGTRAKEK